MSLVHPQRRPGWRLLPVVVIGLLLVVLVYVWTLPNASAGTCTSRVAIEVNASTEKADLLGELAATYNAANRDLGGGKCATVSVDKTASGDAMEALARGWDPARDHAPKPQAWAPTSSMWTQLLQQRGKGVLLRDVMSSITRSVLVVAMPRPMADALRGAHPEGLGWSAILDLVASKGWSSIPGADPRWGTFTLARDNPHRSTSGLAATVASYVAATLKATGHSTVTADDLNRSDVISFVHDVESPVVRYGDDATQFMATLYDEDQAGKPVPPISAIVIQEQLAYLYDKGDPTGDPKRINSGSPAKLPLDAVHPRDGTIGLDHPFVVLADDTAEQAAAAVDFHDFLVQPAQQRRFTELGFRDLNGTPSADLADTVHFDPREQLVPITMPAPAVLAAMQQNWDSVRRKARVLLVLDTSGSMNDPADPSAVAGPTANRSRLDLVRPAAEDGIKLLSDEDEVGLWTFSTGNPLPYRELVPMSPVRDVRQRVIDTIEGIRRGAGDTALYRTTRAAQQAMLASLDTSKINAIVLLSDGANNEPGRTDPQSSNLDQLLQDINVTNLENTVRIYTIPYGNDDGGRHINDLAAIATASKAATYDATNPATIGSVFVAVFGNL